VNYTYDNRFRIKGIEVTSNPGFKYTMSHDKSGNITGLNETYNSQNSENTYTYDALYRMTQAKLGGEKPETLDYKIDNQHNITNKSSSLAAQSPVHIGAFAYDPNKIHAATKAGNINMKYDNAGYMSACGKMGFTWDHLGRLTSATVDGQQRVRYWYDSGVSRTIKEEDGIVSLYPFKELWIRNGYASLFVKKGIHQVAEWRSTKMLTQIYDDIAEGKADGIINAADAWVYHATKQGIESATLKKRPVDLDLTKSMLQAAAYRMLTDGQDEKLFMHTDHLGSVRVLTDKTNVIMTCNWLIGREANTEVGEEEPISVPPSAALAGKIYNPDIPISQPIAGRQYGTLENADGVRFKLLQEHIGQLDQRGLVPMVKEFGGVMPYSARTLYNGDDVGLKTYSVVMVFDWVGKVISDFLNRAAFQNASSKMLNDYRTQIVKFL
ncbi:MAG: hypothetical protein AAF804_20285, partial [Bacteroidota bacterium]